MVSAASLHMAGLHPGLIIPADEHGLLSGVYTFGCLHVFLFVSLLVPAAGVSPAFPSLLGFPPPAQATFVGGFVVGFATLWQLSLVILAIVPVLAVAGGVYAVVLTGLVAKGQQAYSGAGGVAEQMISAVRTVRAR
jgi:ABC-type multidrug transport system fused ATPase/permease subunit